MRILSIKLKNINSLRGEWTVDFTAAPLKDAGLFAMIGAMGSGKSTILDCITLALYNQIPRYGNVSKQAIEKGGLILTKNERDCFAEVKFSCKSGIYSSRWSISKTRNDTYRDYEMQVFDEGGKALADKRTEVPQINGRLIGLDFDQFSKAILLSQGEFAKFLKSSKNERAQLLEEITATKDFRRLGSRAYRVYGQKEGAIKDKLRLIDSLQGTLMSDEAEAELKLQIEVLDKEFAGLSTEMDKLKSRIEAKKRLQQLEQDIELKKSKLESVKKEAAAFELANADALMHYTQLLPYKKDIEEYYLQSAQREKLRNELELSQQQEKTAAAKIAGLIDELGRWVKAEVTEEDFFERLDVFKDRVGEKFIRKQQLADECMATVSRIKNTYKAEDTKEFRTQGGNNELIAKTRERIKYAEFLFAKHKEGHSLEDAKLEPLRSQLQETIQGLKILKKGVANFTLLRTRIRDNEARLLTGVSELEKFSAALDAAQLAQAELQAAFEKAEKDREQMLSTKKLDEYRDQLVEGKPCPLCGSEHHPYVHEYAKDLGKVEDHYSKVKSALDNKRQEVKELELKKLGRAKDLETIRQLIIQDKADTEEFIKEADEWKRKLSIDKIGNVETVEGIIIVHEEKLAAVEYCINYLREQPLLKQLLEELENFDKKQADLLALNKEITALYSGTDIQKDYKQKRDAMQSAMDDRKELRTAISNVEKQKESIQSSLSSLVSSLLTALQELGYCGIPEARSKIIGEALFHELSKRRNDLEAAVKTSEELLLSDQSRLKKESSTDDITISLESLLNEQQGFLSRWNEKKKLLDEQRVSWRRQEQTREQIRDIDEEVRETRQSNLPWELLCGFIGDKTGNTFNTFAQELTLKHLLNFANRRLQKLHQRYVLSMPLSDEFDDLVVIDTNMGNERRSVKTLSGGETFIISLSLALGLSDLASRDINIESLFIDEGFGTLDPEVLEETIGVLEQLQAESSKTVGIISHVDSMKDRIYTQIKLEKQQNGFSTIKIYPETS